MLPETFKTLKVRLRGAFNVFAFEESQREGYFKYVVMDFGTDSHSESTHWQEAKEP